MPNFSNLGGSGGGGGSSGWNGVNPLGGSSGGRSVPLYDSTPRVSSAPGTPDIHPLTGPGSIDTNMMDPNASLKELTTETQDIFAGLKAQLFGASKAGPGGGHGGLLGDVPVLGAVGRFGGEALSNAGGIIQEATERLPSPNALLPFGAMTATVESERLKAEYDAIPADFEGKVAAEAAMAEDKGLFGTGVLAEHGTQMQAAVQAWKTKQVEGGDVPYNALSQRFRANVSFGDTIMNLVDATSLPIQAVERTFAGLGRDLAASDAEVRGLDQLQNIVRVGDGKAVWSQFSKGLTPVEQVVYDNFTSGRWTRDEALDYMAANGAGFSHDTRLEIAANVGLDPLNVAAAGAGALAKVGALGARISEVGATAAKAGELGRLGALNPVARVAHSERAAGMLARYGDFYTSFGATSGGRIAKGVRTLIDPMHAVNLSRADEVVEEGSRLVSEVGTSAYGEFSHIDNLHDLANAADGSLAIARDYEHGLAVYFAHVFRRVAGREYRSAQWANIEALSAELPDLHIKNALSSMTKRTMTKLREEVVRHAPTNFDEPATELLARRMARVFGTLDESEWLARAGKWGADRKALYHASTYGAAVSQLKGAIRTVVTEAQEGKFTDRLGDIILINKDTLTDLGAYGIKNRIAAATSLDGKMAEVRQAMRQYPELRDFRLDPTSDSLSVDEFLNHLERRTPSLPGQISDAERAELPQALADFDDRIRDVFTIGFKPKPEFAWGVERGPDGVLHEIGDPWFDQVTDGLAGYSPVRALSYNVAGQPLPLKPIAAGAKMLDGFEAAGRTVMRGVTGQMVTQRAKMRFTSSLVEKFSDNGLSEGEANRIWNTLQEAMRDERAYTSARGLTPEGLWGKVKAVVDPAHQRAGLGPREMMQTVLEAYDGDIRFIGLTQKLTGRAKVLAEKYTGTNIVGEMSEHVWPLLKFRLNPWFAAQELVEPWVLGIQRGVSIARTATGTSMTEGDRMALDVLNSLVDKNIVNMADNDLGELAGQMAWGKGLRAAAATPDKPLGRVMAALEGQANIRGIKQLNMLRTWKKGLGRTLRESMDKADPGRFDAMWLEAQRATRELIDEDEFATRIVHENLAANDVLVQRITDPATGRLLGYDIDPTNAIREGVWAAPQHIGELRRLDIDHMARRMALRDRLGNDIENEAQLRERIASHDLSWDTVERALRDLNANEDYIRRFDSAIRFSYPGFWQRVQEAFSLTPEERLGFERFYARLAERRGMTPSEYMSQVYSPSIVRGTEGSVGSLGALGDLARLAGVEGTSTVEDLYKQMARTMATHLDPSTKLKVLVTLRPDFERMARTGRISEMTLEAIEDAFDYDVVDELAMRVMGFNRGNPGLGSHAVVAADALPELAYLRNASRAHANAHGAPAAVDRYLYDDDPVLGSEVADAFDDMPDAYYSVATPATLAEKVTKEAILETLTNRPSLTMGGRRLDRDWNILDARSKGAHEAFLKETRELYRELTEVLHVKVTPVKSARPYANADELRADLAKKKLRVPATGYFHPIYKAPDLFMQRAVMEAYGYGQEATQFGSHGAAAAFMPSLSNEARSAFVSDYVARQMWERHSSRVIPDLSVETPTVEYIEARWGSSVQEAHAGMATDEWVIDPKTGKPTDEVRTRRQTRHIGDGWRTLPEEVQAPLNDAYIHLRTHFDIDLDAVDVAPLPNGIGGATLEFGFERPTIVIGQTDQLSPDAAVRQAARQARQQRAILGTLGDEFNGAPRVTPRGVSYTVSQNPEGDFYHEFGHAVHIWLIRQGDGEVSDAVGMFMSQFDDYIDSPKRLLSEYAYNVGDFAPDHPLSQSDSFAELFDLAFNPAKQGYLHGSEIDEDLRTVALSFQNLLEAEGVYVPGGIPAPANPRAGMTIAEAHAAGVPSVARHKPGVLPQPVIDRVTRSLVGDGRFAESNPDIARIAAYFNQSTQDFADSVLRGQAGGLETIFDDASGMPIIDAVPYDMTEAALVHGMQSAMAYKWQDAFRLQYFAQNRSMLQRSINHPMFGLYPASYMWGKVGPELIKFIALEPFGTKTGVMGMSLYRLQTSIATQRALNPEFDEKMESLGHSAAISFLGYMVPATPWSINVGAPGWMKEIARQGLETEREAAAGKPDSGDEWVKPLLKVFEPLETFSTRLNWTNRAIGEFGEVLPWNAEPPEPPPPPVAMPTIFAPKPGESASPVVVGEKPGPDPNGPTQATDLPTIIGDTISDLRAWLGG